MRIILTAAALLLLAACGTTPTPVVSPVRAVVTERVERGDLIGLDANSLAARFGPPRFQVREGDGTKLQFAGGTCLLDAYLYPSVNGLPRVTHVDTRNRDGRPVAQVACVQMIEAR